MIATSGKDLQSEFLYRLSKALVPAEEMPLPNFIREFWQIPQPHPYVHNWHIDAICEHLEAVYPHQQIRNLIIVMPPRMAKSLTVAVFWPMWIWTFSPQIQFVYGSYSRELSMRDSLACRGVILSEEYQKRWGGVFSLAEDENRKLLFKNTKQGHRIATSVAGVATGLGGDILVCDDPHNVKEAPSEAKRHAAILWWTQVMPSRLNNPKTGSRVIVMQRVHKEDLVGHILDTTPDTYDILELPNEYKSATVRVTSLGWRDPRKKDGELLFEERLGREESRGLRAELGPSAYDSQYNQAPSDPAGSLFLRRWWNIYQDVPRKPTGEMDYDEIIHSWDMAFKDTKVSAYVVGQVWLRKGANKYLLDQIRGRMSFTKTMTALKRLAEKWPRYRAILVEDKANGSAVIDALRDKVHALVPVNPEGGKVARAHAITGQLEAGNVYLPNPSTHDWVKDYIEEFANATPEGGGKFWDQIDATTQALTVMSRPLRRAVWGRKSTGRKRGTRSATFGR